MSARNKPITGKRAKQMFGLHDLVEALEAAKEHLEYCGYGDSWERECAFDAKLPERIAEAIRQGKMLI